MSTVYFCSDPHLGHKNICNYRNQFSSAQEHDEYVFQKIINKVSKRDVLWILGDVAFTMDGFSKIEMIASKISKLIIVPGNHDFERASYPTLKDYMSIPNVDIYSLTKYKGFWISHAPIHESELRGKSNIHGHTHYTNVQDERYFNVSLENINYEPVAFYDIPKLVPTIKS